MKSNASHTLPFFTLNSLHFQEFNFFEFVWFHVKLTFSILFVGRCPVSMHIFIHSSSVMPTGWRMQLVSDFFFLYSVHFRFNVLNLFFTLVYVIRILSYFCEILLNFSSIFMVFCFVILCFW
jgi:hypothetical protein